MQKQDNVLKSLMYSTTYQYAIQNNIVTQDSVYKTEIQFDNANNMKFL